MNQEPLDVLPIWCLFLTILVLTGLALEAGYRFGSWRHALAADEKESSVGAMVASILGLLAFLLAFTFSLAASRFEARRETVLEEANAIGTTYLRSRLLPEPQKSKAASLLREYVDVRVRGVQEGKVEETIARSEQLHDAIWSEATEAAQNPNGTPVMTSLFIQALNEMIDLHAKRLMVGLRNRIPVSIWAVLFALALLSMASVGYQSGIAATRRSPAMFGMVFAFAGVLFLIADLDRPHEGFLRVSQQPMLDVQKSMHAGEPRKSP
jgi:hypothetical protein